MDFDLIKNIQIEKDKSWKKKVFITIDIEWVSDEILEYTINYLKKRSIQTTFFATHKTELLSEIKNCDLFDIGIHPNFNKILLGENIGAKNLEGIADKMFKIVPNAKILRSHSLTNSSLISNYFKNRGIEFECNIYIPYSSDIIIKPWKHEVFNLTMLSHLWEDDINLMSQKKISAKSIINSSSLKIIAFHPSHIYINSYKYSQYEEFKKGNIEINESHYGTRDFLKDIIKLVKEDKYE